MLRARLNTGCIISVFVLALVAWKLNTRLDAYKEEFECVFQVH